MLGNTHACAQLHFEPILIQCVQCNQQTKYFKHSLQEQFTKISSERQKYHNEHNLWPAERTNVMCQRCRKDVFGSLAGFGRFLGVALEEVHVKGILIKKSIGGSAKATSGKIVRFV